MYEQKVFGCRPRTNESEQEVNTCSEKLVIGYRSASSPMVRQTRGGDLQVIACSRNLPRQIPLCCQDTPYFPWNCTTLSIIVESVHFQLEAVRGKVCGLTHEEFISCAEGSSRTIG
jgi:hypothetical protein